MSFTEKIVVGQISGKVMHSGKVMYMGPFTLLKQEISTSKLRDMLNKSYNCYIE